MSTSSHIYVWQVFGNSKVQPSVFVLLKKKRNEAYLFYEKRNSQISISNFKFNFNRKILKMCTSKFFPCSVYTYVCVLIHRNAHVPHIFTKFKWKYFCPLFFPTHMTSYL